MPSTVSEPDVHAFPPPSIDATAAPAKLLTPNEVGDMISKKQRKTNP